MLLQSQDGAIHLLPALPDDWSTGEVTGLRAYGGFEVNFSWERGQVQSIVIKSNLGGNCRIRVPNEVVLLQGMTPASGVNPNNFFATPEIKNPIIRDSSKIKHVDLKPTLLYDLPTQAGGTYIIAGIVGVKQSDSQNPQYYSLEQNYPNPFNPQTRIDYQIPQTANVNISVFNIIGQLVATLVDEVKSSGQYSVSWNAIDQNGLHVSSGVYIARMVSNNYSASIKLTLIK
jgi:hypothetical protein